LPRLLEERGKLALDGQQAVGNRQRVEDGASHLHGMVQPVGNLVEVAADAPNGQHKRGIDAGDGPTKACFGQAQGLAQQANQRPQP
jgi:hypothetical protein